VIWYLVTQGFGLDTGSFWMVLLSILFAGMINISIYSSCFEYVARLAPDVGESLSSGLVNGLANVLGFLEIISFQAMTSSFTATNDLENKLNMWMFIMFGGLAAALAL
jgi:hypothetical protein